MAGSENIHEVRVASRSSDPEASRVLRLIQPDVPEITGVASAKVYAFQGVDPARVGELSEIVVDPVAEDHTLDAPILHAPLVVRIGPQPGVMDSEGDTVAKEANDRGMAIDPINRRVLGQRSTEYAIYGEGVSPERVRDALRRHVMNVTTGRFIDGQLDTLAITGERGPVLTVPLMYATDEQLETLSRDTLFLDLADMQVMRAHFRDEVQREPTDVEVQVIAAFKSDHCDHRTFNADVEVDGVIHTSLYGRIKNEARKHFKGLVLSAFVDNAGVMRFYPDEHGVEMAINAKGETHNAPTALAPDAGSGTGVGGVERDVAATGLGAEVIAGGDVLVFGSRSVLRSELPKGVLDPQYIARGTIAGIGNGYGNPMGIPTVNGSISYTREGAFTKPIVIVLAFGKLPESRAQKGQPQVGDRIVVMGGRTGRDGIHGATFSSGAMTERTATVNASAVQIGDPIQQRKVFDAIKEAAELGLIRAVNDCGAAGFSSAVGEMGKHVGIEVDLSKVPTKYPGLAPWEIWLSESQERMALAVDPEKLDALLAVCHKHDVEASDIGFFNGSNRMQVNYGDERVADLDYRFLEDGFPRKRLRAHWEPTHFDERVPEMPQGQQAWINAVKEVLGHENVCSKESVVRTYDHTVRGATVLTPFSGKNNDGPNDGAVLRPLPGMPYGLVVAHGINPGLSRINPADAARWVMAEAMANFVAVGGNPDEACWVNNYISGKAEYPEVMGSLHMTVDAVVEGMQAFDIPVISGKDSVSNTRLEKDGTVIHAPTTLCMTAFGRIPDIAQTVTSPLKKPGSRLYLVGQLDQGMGGSTYYDIHGLVGNEVPKINLPQVAQTLRGVHNAIKTGKVLACHDVSQGGVAGAVAEMCFGGDMGVQLDLQALERPDMMLFNETAGALIVEVPDDATAEELFAGVPHMALGTTQQAKTMQVQVGGQMLFAASVDELKTAWQEPMRRFMNG